MPKIESFHIGIKDGRFIFKSAQHREMFKRWLYQWDDKSVMVEITEKKSKRSDQQNRYYWGVYLPIIAEETGHTVNELHALFKGMFAGEIKEVLGKKVNVTDSTADMTRGEFCEYIVNIENHTNIPAPDTTDVMGYYPKNY